MRERERQREAVREIGRNRQRTREIDGIDRERDRHIWRDGEKDIQRDRE